MKIKGDWKTRRIWIDGKELLPGRSQKVANHSPDGFNWGYGGSGPAQLALAILLRLLPKDKAVCRYQKFKWDVIARLPQSDFEIDLDPEGYV
ncbi:MAG: hypothetical protein HWN68_06435 [Desulfobacterales bacterium]|nr:hypothetical protein [Desulfobacterales bacterium]